MLDVFFDLVDRRLAREQFGSGDGLLNFYLYNWRSKGLAGMNSTTKPIWMRRMSCKPSSRAMLTACVDLVRPESVQQLDFFDTSRDWANFTQIWERLPLFTKSHSC